MWLVEGVAFGLEFGFDGGFGFEFAHSLEDLAGDFAVVEGVFDALDVLVGFVAFACDEDDVALGRAFEGGLDGLAAVDDFGGASFAAETGGGVFDDGGRVFGAGVVGGEDADVAAIFGGGGHAGAFGAVAVATAAEDGDDAVGFEGAEGAEDVVEGVRSVGVVDVDVEASLVADAFEAAGDLGGGAEVLDGFAEVEAHEVGGGESAEGIVDIEVANVGEANEEAAAFDFEFEGGAGEITADVDGAVVGLDAVTEADDAAGGLVASDEFAAPEVVAIDDEVAVALGGDDLKETDFGSEVVLHAAVVVEVVLSEIGEDGGLEGEAVGALLVEGVGGDFHGAAAAAVGAHFGEELLDFQAFRGGVGGGDLGAAEVVEDGAEEAGAELAGVHQVVDDEGGGGFAIGAGDASDFELASGVVVEGGGGLGEGDAGVADVDPGDFGIGRGGLFREDDGGTGFDGGGDEAIAVGVGAAQGEEGGAGGDGTGVVGDGFDGSIEGTARNGSVEKREEVAEDNHWLPPFSWFGC